MWKSLLLVIAGLNAFVALFMWFAPQLWYDITPGVAMMGPFNLHFIRDVSLAYATSTVALAWGAMQRQRNLALVGAFWPCAHACFHLWIWFARGLPLDLVAAVNLMGIQPLAWLALLGALKLGHEQNLAHVR